MRDDAIPALVLAAGDAAVCAYREFLDDPRLAPSTRMVYGERLRRFFHWAEARGLTLETIDGSTLPTYWIELTSINSHRSAYLTPVRGLIRHLARSGVLASDFCAESITVALETLVAGFPLLDLLAFLGNMAVESLSRVFDDEQTALSLFERVRWPDGPLCPHCATAAVADSPVQATCTACGRAFTVATGTMFCGSPVPVRHWFFLIHQWHLATEPLPAETVAQHLSLKPPAIAALRLRMTSTMFRENVPAPPELTRAIERRNRELREEDATRAIIFYAQITDERERLLGARAECTPVEDLPPGMTLDEAIARVEHRIANEDRYVFTVEDGLLVRYRTDPAPDAAQSPQPNVASHQTDSPHEATDAQ